MIVYKNQSKDLKPGGMPMASSLQQFSNVGPSSKEEIQQEVQSNDGRKFELWPEH